MDENSNSWKVDQKNQLHWIPDQLCKTCYGCETHFNMFPRKRHCRLCGQVLCNPRSSFFVEIIEGRTNFIRHSNNLMSRPLEHAKCATYNMSKFRHQDQMDYLYYFTIVIHTTEQENTQKGLPGNNIDRFKTASRSQKLIAFKVVHQANFQSCTGERKA